MADTPKADTPKADTPDRPLRDDAAGTTAAPPQRHTATRTRPGDHRATRTRPGAAAARRRATGLLATAVSTLTTVVVAILAVHILFTVFEANTSNDLVRWFTDRATDLCWQFKDVFQPDDPKLEVTVNYGLAALVYLLVGRALGRLIRRLA